MAVLLSPAVVAKSKIALIIDDMGNKASDLKALSLPGDITFSILPFTPFSLEIAAQAQRNQQDVMLHIPMEALGGNRLGPGAITSQMADAAIYQTLFASLQQIPEAIGINNHMGSKLTQLTRPMKTTMQFLRDNELFFVDSRTTRYSRAESIAQQYGVTSFRRHVFLDHYPAEKQIAQQFSRLKALAKKHGFAIGIAHPYESTINYLAKTLPQLENSDIQLVAASTIAPAKRFLAATESNQQAD